MSSSYHIIRIQRYLNGELSGNEMYELEREALNDPLLQDALEGYRLQQNVSHRQLSLLQQRLADRIAGQEKERNAFFFGWQRLGVAATACVLMILVLVLLWMRHQSAQRQVSEKEVHVELVSPESLVSVQVVASTGPGLDAHPQSGWHQFNTYLNDGLSGTSLRGRTTLAFDVNAQGEATNVQIIDETNSSLTGEIRRLLEQGPRWEGSRGQLEVAFE